MFIQSLIKWLPLRCELCQLELTQEEKAQSFSWCSICNNSLQRNARCLRCGLPTAIDTDSCGRCLKDPPVWQNLKCINTYQFPYDKLLHRFKYQKQFWLINNLIPLLVKEIPTPAPLLIPVPMHWKRQLMRGYNQSHVIAMQLAKSLNIACNAKALVRTRATQQQQGLNRKQRLSNLNNAFSLRQSLPKHIAVVDDVVTTGATINEICKVLKKHDVEKIDVYCIARSF